MKIKKGKVYLIGAGPGDPELITLKGYKILQKADVILHDYLIDPAILKNTKSKAEIIMTGKSGKCHFMKQDEINALMVEKAAGNKIVVRLKNGDPFIFGRGGEEIIYLAKHHIAFEVIPGVSSTIGVPTACNIPLTHRDYTASLSLITGHTKDHQIAASSPSDTLVYVMGVANLQAIISTLLKNNHEKETPCLIIQNGTKPNQKIIEGTLENIFEISQKENITAPAIFIVGKVLNIYKELKQLLNS